MALGFFTDAVLATQLAGNLIVTQKSDGSSGPSDYQLWLGDPDTNYLYQADSDPGVDNVQIEVVDASPGSGQEATAITLADTQTELDTATPGDPLLFPTQLVGGPGGAREFWLRVEDVTGVIGSSTELSFRTNVLRRLPV